MKLFAGAAALLLALGMAHEASAIEILNNPGVHGNTLLAPRHGDLMVVRSPALPQASQGSELPEPEVFAMMVLGLVLIGWRARRESSEKFR